MAAAWTASDLAPITAEQRPSGQIVHHWYRSGERLTCCPCHAALSAYAGHARTPHLQAPWQQLTDDRADNHREILHARADPLQWWQQHNVQPQQQGRTESGKHSHASVLLPMKMLCVHKRTAKAVTHSSTDEPVMQRHMTA
jgi:hypothetical protein